MMIRAQVIAFYLALFAIGVFQAHSHNPPVSKAISELKEAIVKGLGFQSEDFKISGFDLRDALVGQSIAYEFDIEIDDKILPFKLLEDVSRWEYVDLPIFRVEEVGSGAENGLAERSKSRSKNKVFPTLEPFQLAGPMELWIQDGDDMRLSLPHDVDAGVLKKVILAEGAVVTVKGARSVSLRHPLDLPLPLNRSHLYKDRSGGFASGLLTLAEHLRLASISRQHNPETNGQPLLSLRIVGPSSLNSLDTVTASTSNHLKLKRLAPGLVELSARAQQPPHIEEALPILSPQRFTTLWPLTSVNGSNANLRGFEDLLHAVLGEKAKEEGSFRLLKAEVSAQTFMKIEFDAERGLMEGDIDWNTFPEWQTKPETVRMRFEVLAKVEGEKVVPERVLQMRPLEIEQAIAPNLLSGNVSMSQVPIAYPPPEYFSL